MKYIYLLLIILLLPSCKTIPKDKEDYNYLEDNSIRFIKDKEDTELLINKNNIFYLIVLDNKLDITIPYDQIINIPNKETLSQEDLIITITDKIEITLNNNTLCIYQKHLDQDNYKDCDYIYLYKIEDNFYITLNNNIKMLFYNAYTKFNYRFLYMLSQVWIGTTTLEDETYTTLTIEKNDFTITTTKKRGKTIHKRPKT